MGNQPQDCCMWVASDPFDPKYDEEASDEARILVSSQAAFGWICKFLLNQVRLSRANGTTVLRQNVPVKSLEKDYRPS